MKLHWEWTFDVSRERLWPWLADTDWINRHAGLPSIASRNEALPDGGTRRLASFRMGPMRVEWEERPTRWRTPEFYEVERVYTKGPLKRFVNRMALETLGAERTRVIADYTLEPRNAAFAALLPLLAWQGRAGADRAFTLAASRAAGAAPPSFDCAGLFGPLYDRGGNPEAIAALERYFSETDDRELATLRPYEIADRYGVSRKDVLRACLAATRAGLFNLRWGVICTSCRGTPNAFGSLESLRTDLHCPSCNIAYGPQFDRSVEVTFDPKPIGRGVDVPLFCVASPERSAHVLAQTALQPGEQTVIDVELPPGSYDINAIGAGMTPFVVSHEALRVGSLASIEHEHVVFPHEIGAGPAEIAIENLLDREAIVRIEEGRWPDTIATAAQVTAMQDFRDLFSSEVLAPGLELGIQSIAILFTDLIGSTAMYSSAGDAPAFRIVTDHFDRIRAVFDRCDGAIVKTIGDAVMGVFGSPADCLRAALELDASVRGLAYDGMPLRLRVGFHFGPCIAMRANDRIDYFGTTVNLAARLESQAGAGEVVLARGIAERPDVAALLQSSGRALSGASVSVKGFAAPVEVVRIAEA
jgi:class 3 adenylate cyclase